jgi:hypothetical protein
MGEHLLTAETWPLYTRAVSQHLDDEEVEKWIDECEQLFIVPAIGADLFVRLADGEELTEQEEKLLEGGSYIQERCGCSDAYVGMFKGLRWALSYFVLAKMIRNDGGMLSRGGFFRHDDEHGSHLDDRNNVNRYNDVMNVAETYLNGALLYWKSINKEDCKSGARVRGSRVRIISVGD